MAKEALLGGKYPDRLVAKTAADANVLLRQTEILREYYQVIEISSSLHLKRLKTEGVF